MVLYFFSTEPLLSFLLELEEERLSPLFPELELDLELELGLELELLELSDEEPLVSVVLVHSPVFGS